MSHLHHCQTTISNNPFKDLPTDAWEALIELIFEMQSGYFPFELGDPRPLPAIDDGDLELVQLHNIKCHDMEWIPVQVRTRQSTLFTVYVQSDAYHRGDIPNWPILHAMERGARMGTCEQTVCAPAESNGVHVQISETHPEELDVD